MRCGCDAVAFIFPIYLKPVLYVRWYFRWFSFGELEKRLNASLVEDFKRCITRSNKIKMEIRLNISVLKWKTVSYFTKQETSIQLRGHHVVSVEYMEYYGDHFISLGIQWYTCMIKHIKSTWLILSSYMQVFMNIALWLLIM